MLPFVPFDKAANRFAAISSREGLLADPPLLLLLILVLVTVGSDGDETTPSCGKDETAVAVGYDDVVAAPTLLAEPGNASATGVDCEDDE